MKKIKKTLATLAMVAALIFGGLSPQLTAQSGTARILVASIEGGTVQLFIEYNTTSNFITRIVCDTRNNVVQPQLTVLDRSLPPVAEIVDSIRLPAAAINGVLSQFSRVVPGGKYKVTFDERGRPVLPLEIRFSS